MREATAKAGVSAQEVAGPSDATREPKPVETVLGGAKLEVPDIGGSKPRSTVMTQATVEAAEAKTSVRDVGRADVKKSREVVEAPPEARKEAT
jgi:hypothetical protein